MPFSIELLFINANQLGASPVPSLTDNSTYHPIKSGVIALESRNTLICILEFNFKLHSDALRKW